MDNKDNNKTPVLELEISHASMTVKCDACKAVLGERWASGRNNITLALNMGEDESGYARFKDHHFCGESCLLAHLQTRVKKT